MFSFFSISLFFLVVLRGGGRACLGGPCVFYLYFVVILGGRGG